MMVRFGFHPCFASSPSARASSSSTTWPETGSSAPLTQRIVVVAAQHPQVGLLGAAHGRDHVVNRFEVPVESELQMDLSRPWAHAIGNGQRSAPIRGRDGTFERSKQRLRVGVGDRQNRNLGKRLGILAA